MIKISTSILSAKNRIDSIIKLNNTNTDYLHIDVMDNKFVPNYQFPIAEIINTINLSTKPVDIHLMVENPEEYIDKITNNKIEFITIHIEIKKDINELLNKIKSLGYKTCLSIKPNTSIDDLKPYINNVDMILVMSVEPGFGGQEFIETTYEKINEIKKLNNSILIEVDGGINDKTIKKVQNADIAVVGSFIINSNNYQEAINNLKN